MEGPCDFAIHLSRGYEIANPCFKSRDVGVIAVAAHIAPDLVLADGTGLPDDSDPDLAALGPLIEDDLFHNEPKDLLALDHARRIPQFGKILTQRDNLSAVRRGKRYRLLAGPVDLLRLPELVLPYALQRPCQQTVLGFDGIVLTARPLRLIARSLALERPLTLDRASFALKLAESGNRESEAIGCQRSSKNLSTTAS